MLEVNGPEKRVSGSSYSGETILKIRGRADGTGLIAAEKQIEEELSLRSPEERSQMVEKSRKSEIKATQRHNAIRVECPRRRGKDPPKRDSTSCLACHRTTMSFASTSGY